ncbi:hypothetical protein Q73_04185 [Bacillus coahuilensis m2-6]|uniref:YhcN/YlaJ family sporulation lipoprotein n=1 Tax=Bacillus coahuilensis TaxID=408580 RepID=UPI0001850F65|nr:YhcN/YlaJ family sporulation lipoprotein [Bacillus coahuilensis]KUP09009.1 hypothetical protein Q73_04185 [Bacillus coahuilensis m2-6]
MKFFSMFFIVLLLVTGCQSEESFDNKKSQTALIKTTNPSPVDLDNKDGISTAQLVKQYVEAKEELYDVAVVEGEKEILVAYKVKHYERFHMKKIEDDLSEALEKKFTEKDILVSSDYKIFLEVVRMEESLNKGELTKKEAKKRLSELVDLKEATT